MSRSWFYLKPCGTEAAYRRHLRRGEQPCEACRAATAYAAMLRMRRVRQARRT
jgi:hypothetical protein